MCFIFFPRFPAVPHMALLSIQATSPERRFTQKEIIAGEERPKYLLIKHQDTPPAPGSNTAPATAGTYKLINSSNLAIDFLFFHFLFAS